MTDLRERVAAALRVVAEYDEDQVAAAFEQGDFADHSAQLALAALGLDDLTEFARSLHAGYFDDDGPSGVELACMLSAVEYALTDRNRHQGPDQWCRHGSKGEDFGSA